MRQSALDKPCREYPGKLNHKGYAVNMNLLEEYGTRYVHRAVLSELLGRRLLSEEMACHHCDNRRCTEPTHLYLGNAKTNAEDRERRGRGNHPTGFTIPEQQRSKISASLTGRPHSQERKEAISKGRAGVRLLGRHVVAEGKISGLKKSNSGWRVYICGEYLGHFTSFLDACCARRSAEIRWGFTYEVRKRN